MAVDECGDDAAAGDTLPALMNLLCLPVADCIDAIIIPVALDVQAGGVVAAAAKADITRHGVLKVFMFSHHFSPTVT